MIPSYHDLNNENSYHIMMLGMCLCLSDNYKVIYNREEGKGRCDLIIQAHDEKKTLFIIEFKYFKEDKKEKFFLSLPLITLSYTGLILTLVFGTLCMLVSFLPYWVAVIICAVILAVYAIAVLKAKAAAEISSATGEKVKAKTFFIRSLTVDCENLLAKAKSEQAKAACNKVYEAVRYSDPMSSDELSSVEEKISAKIGELSTAVIACDDEKITALADETVLLVKERNSKCKVLK